MGSACILCVIKECFNPLGELETFQGDCRGTESPSFQRRQPRNSAVFHMRLYSSAMPQTYNTLYIEATLHLFMFPMFPTIHPRYMKRCRVAQYAAYFFLRDTNFQIARQLHDKRTPESSLRKRGPKHLQTC